MSKTAINGLNKGYEWSKYILGLIPRRVILWSRHFSILPQEIPMEQCVAVWRLSLFYRHLIYRAFGLYWMPQVLGCGSPEDCQDIKNPELVNMLGRGLKGIEVSVFWKSFLNTPLNTTLICSNLDSSCHICGVGKTSSLGSISRSSIKWLLWIECFKNLESFGKIHCFTSSLSWCHALQLWYLNYVVLVALSWVWILFSA